MYAYMEIEHVPSHKRVEVFFIGGLKYKRNFNKLQVLYCNNYNKWRTNLDQIQ